VCTAINPEVARALLVDPGKKLKTAIDEHAAATTSEDRLKKLGDLAGAVGELYNTVEKLTKACQKVPAATFRLGYLDREYPSPAGKDDPLKPRERMWMVTVDVPW
jgi:hypothetical protein